MTNVHVFYCRFFKLTPVIYGTRFFVVVSASAPRLWLSVIYTGMTYCSSVRSTLPGRPIIGQSGPCWSYRYNGPLFIDTVNAAWRGATADCLVGG